jgi:iron(III) transport system ATP-binding protein
MAAKCQINGLSKRFGSHVAVSGVSLDIADGEFIVLLGPSGCGKTTTLRLIAGLEVPSGGTISIDGRLVSDPARNIFVPPERRDIGMVFQSYAIWPHMTVFENVAYPLRVRRTPRGELRDKVAKVLDVVGLSGEAQRSATALSGGQMQRVALARALVADPTLLLFDEPLSNLDLKLRERLRIELKELQQRTGLTSIYVTHDQAEAVELADRIVVMQAGRMLQVGPPVELYRQPQARFVAEFISSANIFEATVDAMESACEASVSTIGGRRLAVRTEQPVSVGDRVDVVVHPEDCRLVDARDAAATGYPARILQRRFQGTSTRYTVMWNDEPFDVVAQGTAHLFEEDAEAKLCIAPQCARIIPHGTSRP